MLLHVAAVGALLAIPATGERFALTAPVFVEYLQSAQVRPPEARPLPRPVLREPPIVQIAPPPIALTVETAPPVAEHPAMAQAAAAVAAPRSAPDAAAVEPPRFDMAYLRNPPPSYPSLSRRMREQGRVVLHVLVSAAGAAESIEVRASSGYERLDRAAIEAVRQWRFVPAHRGADAIAAWALVPVLFKLDA